jgi:hypothetical protein
LYGRTGLKRETITFSDSKGLDLKEVIPNCVSDKLSIVARKGATVFSEEHQKDLYRKVRKAYNPFILIWLGTCEISKKDKYIKLRYYPYQNIELVLTEYRELKKEILRINRYAKVLFIEYPYYSISKSNRLRRGTNNSVRESNKNNNTIVRRNYNGRTKDRKYPQLVINKVIGGREVQLATQTDKELCQQIYYYNEYLSMINSIKTPRILQDIISSSKPKQSTYVKHRKNFN